MGIRVRLKIFKIEFISCSFFLLLLLPAGNGGF